MNRYFFFTVIFAFAFSGATLRADDGEHGDSGGVCNTNWTDGNTITNQDGGCQIEGSETLVATVTLVPTNNAPATAGGVARLISDNKDGVINSSFTLMTTGLSSGVYTLSIVKISDGSTLDLGQITIEDNSSGSEDGDQGDDQGDDNEGDTENQKHMHGEGHQTCGDTFLTESDVTLPPDLNPSDIGQIALSDESGNAVLVGDLLNPVPTSSIKFKAVLRLSGTSKTTKISNKAQASSKVKKGRRTDRFTMLAANLSPNTTFTITVNGKPVGTARSNKKGKLVVKKLHANPLAVKSVKLVDTTGQTAAVAKF